MSRFLPYPLLTLSLLVMWLLLQQSLELGHVVMGLAIALIASKAMAALQPQKPRIRRPGLILRLIVLVFLDVLRSNLAVARIVIMGRQSRHTAGFLHLPLELRDRYGLAVLACIITATPGSSWLEYDANENTVLIHVLDLVDPEDWAKTIKARYETLLLEIFQ